MAQAPTVDLPKRLPLVINPENRDDTAAKDAKLVNCYCEKGDDGMQYIYKRAGMLFASQPPAAAATGRGTYNWKNDVYTIFGNKLYKSGVAVTGTVDTTNGVYRFNQILGTTNKLFFDNGVTAYNYDPVGGLAAVTDVNFTAPRVKGSAYLDASTYVMNSSAVIQASALNDTTSWPSLNVLTAQIEPDGGVAVGKQLVYVVAFKQWTTELFYDAANATGSPLGPVQGAKINYGCLHQDSVQDIDGVLVWLSVNRSAAPQIVLMDNLKAEVVSTKPVERLLKGLDYTTVYSWSFKEEGHRFYILTIKNSNLTLAYDLAERRWAQWTDTSGNYVPIVAATYDSTLRHIWQHESNGNLYYGSRAYTNDANSIITADIYPPVFDGGTKRNKLMNQMGFVTDQTPGSILLVRKSDDDYQSWSNFRSVDLSRKHPVLTNCGSFRRRAYHMRHQCNTSMRLMAVELQLDIGTL